jgi:hypothetical protein
MKSRIFELEVEGKEFPEMMNAMVRLTKSRRIAWLTILGFSADEISPKVFGEFVRIEPNGWSELQIEIFESDNEKWDWRPTSLDETANSSLRIGTVPTDFCAYVRADRDFYWESDLIPLNDGTFARFTGATIGSLMEFALGEQRRQSAKVDYLNKHPNRLDEDLIALQEELESEEFDLRWN